MEVEELSVILLRGQGKDAMQGGVLVANKISQVWQLQQRGERTGFRRERQVQTEMGREIPFVPLRKMLKLPIYP